MQSKNSKSPNLKIIFTGESIKIAFYSKDEIKNLLGRWNRLWLLNGSGGVDITVVGLCGIKPMVAHQVCNYRNSYFSLVPLHAIPFSLSPSAYYTLHPFQQITYYVAPCVVTDGLTVGPFIPLFPLQKQHTRKS